MAFHFTFEEIQQFMEKMGVPARDAYDLPSSPKRFPDGAHYRNEISGIERPSTMAAMLDEAKKQKVKVHRVIGVTMGATLLTMNELKEMARMAAGEGAEFVALPGPRAMWDIGRMCATPEGAYCGIRIRGSDYLSYTIADLLRCLEAGIRGFLVWDEGLLMILNEMRNHGTIPRETILKVSVFTGHANAASIRLIESLGANTINPLPDLTLPMLGAIRSAIKIPMDLHISIFDSQGGWYRVWEVPEICRVCAPCYLKQEPGRSVAEFCKPWTSETMLADLARQKVRNVQIMEELIHRLHPELTTSELGTKDMTGVPVAERGSVEVAEIVARRLAFPEGPVVLPDGRIAVCEQFRSQISVYNGKKVSRLAKTGGSPNGATLGSDGNLYVAQNGGVVGDWRAKRMIAPSIQRVTMTGEVEQVCTEVAGIPLLAPNDICFGPDGRLYFTDPAHGYDPNNRTEDGRIYAIDSQGRGELAVRRQPVYTNGIGFLPDGTLVWVESYDRNVCALKNGRVVVLCALPENHVPDGFAVADDGRLFIATVMSHGVTIISPEGKYLGLIKLDDDALTTNCAFQGNVLWVTDVGNYLRNRTGGRLWRVETDATGMTMHAGAI